MGLRCLALGGALLAPSPAFAGVQASDEATPIPQDTEAEAVPEPAVERGYAIHGRTRLRYRGRFSPLDNDHDLTQTLDLDLGDRERDAWTFHVSALGSVDLDGRADSGDVFFDLSDTYSTYGRLYEAYADAHGSGRLTRLRAGRQMTYETPVFLWYDGVSAETEELDTWASRRTAFGAFGGRSVHAHESSPDGDFVFGLYALARPWEAGRVRVDWLHAEDESILGTADDDLVSIELWQQWSASVDAYASYALLNGDDKDYRLRGGYHSPDGDLYVRASYYELLTPQRDLTTELDPFFSSLLELFPYWQAQVLVSQDLNETLTMQLGSDVRRVSDSGDVGAFNRDFERYFASGVAHHLAHAGDALTLTAETWRGEDRINTWGASFDTPLTEALELSVGSYFSLYRFDLGVDDEERERVRTVHSKLRYRYDARTSFDVAYEFADDVLADTHALRIGVSYRF